MGQHPTTTRLSTSKNERFEARITRDQKRAFEHAARIEGTSVTNFVVASAHAAAKETIKNSQVLILRSEASRAFVNALLNPPAPNAAARTAWQRYKELKVR